MSLANLLATKAVDEGLDDIFKSSAGPSTIATVSSVDVRASPQKRKSQGTVKDKTSKKSRRKSRISESPIPEDDGNKLKHRIGEDEDKEPEVAAEGVDKSVSSADEDDASPTVPQHESVKKSGKRKDSAKRTKYVPEGETKEKRDARTIFIGNLPVAVVKSKPLTKQLKRHILSLVSSAKIESIRYRSIAFRTPTSTLEEEGDGKASTKEKRQQIRAADWRAQKQDAGWPSKLDKEEVEEDKKGEKSYMTPAEKRRLAAINGELHEHSAATTNAYVVFAYPVPVAPDRSELHVPQKEVMDPFIAAREAVGKVNGTFFAEHMLRVDFVGKSLQDSNAAVGAQTDPKLSLFVGNLDFATSEDDLRAFFEKVMCEERGKPEAIEGKEVEINSLRQPTWVTRVRIVRDRETQLGKGFAYVQFADRDCVDEVLALESDKLKFAKRALRVQRCKTVTAVSAKPKSSSSIPKTTSGVTTNPRPRAPSISLPLPKGDPTLGARLAGLPKESRKKAKASDPTRVARRLAKKKARAALEKAGAKGNRVRERKDKKAKGTSNTGRKEGKKRERSQKNLERKNVKK